MTTQLEVQWIGVVLLVGAGLLAGFFEYFYRLYGRRYLRLWALSALAAVVHGVADFLPLSFSSVGQSFAVPLLRAGTGYAHCGFLVFASYEAMVGRSVGRWVVPGVLGTAAALALVGIPLGETGISNTEVLEVVGVLYPLVTGSAYLLAAVLVGWGHRRRGVGWAVVTLAFALHGLQQFYMFWSPLGSALLFLPSFLQFWVELLIAIGFVIWLLEEERDRAVSTATRTLLDQQAPLRRFRRMLELGWDIVELRRQDGTVEWVSKSVERVLGLTVEAYLATSPLDSVHPDDRDSAWRILLETGVSREPAEVRMLGGDGEYRHMEVVCVDLSGDSEVRSRVVTWRDVTERHALQRVIIEASGRERRNIGKDLHDGLGQLLTGIGFKVARLEGILTPDDPRRALAGEIKGLVRDAVTRADVLARGLSPATVEPEGIVSALRSLADSVTARHGVDCAVEHADIDIRAPEVANQVYMIAQEVVQSAIQNHGSSVVRISLSGGSGDGVLSVWSDRVASPEVASGREVILSDGIAGHRASVINASLEVQRPSEGGRRVTCRFQWNAADGFPGRSPFPAGSPREDRQAG